MTKTPGNLMIGDTVAIGLSAGPAANGSWLDGHATLSFSTVIEATEKAVKLQGETLSGKEISTWIPRRALTGTDPFALARWFQLSPWQVKWLGMTSRTHVGGGDHWLAPGVKLI